jgi:hypothetical protein
VSTFKPQEKKLPIFSISCRKPVVAITITPHEINITKQTPGAKEITTEQITVDQLQPEELTDYLRPIIEKLNLNGLFASISLPHQHIMTKRLKLPLCLNEQECEAEVTDYLEQSLFTTKEAMYFDFLISDKQEEDYQYVYLFVAKKLQIDAWVNAITQANLLVKTVNADATLLLAAVKWDVADTFHGRHLHFNLLPWRLEKKLKKSRQININRAIGLLVGLLIGGLIHIFLHHNLFQLTQTKISLEKVKNQTQVLADKLHQLQNKLEELKQQKIQLENFQQQQTIICSAIRDVVTLGELPIRLTDISYAEEVITIIGEVDALIQLKALVDQINHANYLSHVRIKHLKRLLPKQAYHFELSAHLFLGGPNE